MALSCQNTFVMTFQYYTELFSSICMSSPHVNSIYTAPYRPSPSLDVWVISGNRAKSHDDQPLASFSENLTSRCMLFSLKNLPGYLSKTAISHDFKTFTKNEKREGLSAFDLSCFLEPAPKPTAASTPAQEVCLVCTAAEQWPLACKRPHGLGAANWRGLTGKQEPPHVKTNGHSTCDWCTAELEIESNAFTILLVFE